MASGHLGIVTRLDGQTNTVRARIHLRPVVCCLAVGGGFVWATSQASGLLWKLRPGGAVQDVVHLPAPATEVAYANGSVWVSGYSGGTVTRIDADTLHASVVRTDQGVAGVAAAPGIVAFSTLPSERSALAGVRGPVARIVMAHDYPADSDPAVGALYGDADADRQLLGATCLALYEYTDRRLTPYAASGPAVKTSNDRVWTFRVRRSWAHTERWALLHRRTQRRRLHRPAT